VTFRCLQLLAPYVKGEITPSKQSLLGVCLARFVVNLGITLFVVQKCGMHLLGLCLCALFFAMMEDCLVLGKLLRGKPVLESNIERFKFCFQLPITTLKRKLTLL